MAGGGSHWYRYRICFDDKNQLDGILREDKDGVHLVEKYHTPVIITNNDGTQFIKFENDNFYECKDNEHFMEWYD